MKATNVFNSLCLLLVVWGGGEDAEAEVGVRQEK